MNPRLAHLLVCLYPRPWRQRYGAEFVALLESGPATLRVAANVIGSALGEHILPSPGDAMNPNPPSRFQSWSERAPWAMFGLAPLVLLAGAYFAACFILWSGWRIFLPDASTPFVPIEGFAIVYFGLGRALYFGAPILIGWTIAFTAARQRIKALWPVAGLLLIALISVSAQVHASRPVPSAAGHVSIDFALRHSAQSISSGLLNAVIIFVISLSPYIILRLKTARVLGA